MATQDAWRFCQKCHVMFFDGYPDKGSCPTGGGHEAQGFMFFLPHDVQFATFPPTVQYDWRYCQKCHAMFFDGYPDKGSCPTGGGHEAQGFMFFLPHDTTTGETANAQGSWRYCQKCHVMFFDGYPDKGSCPTGGGHEAQGFMFFLPHDVPPTLDFNFSPIVFDGGVPVGGNAHLTLRQDGTATFSGHFHDSGLPSYNTAAAWGIKDSQNIAYQFKHSGHVSGHSPFASSSHDDNWNTPYNDDRIAQYWAYIASSYSSQAKAGADIDVSGLADQVKQALGYVLDVVEVIAA